MSEQSEVLIRDNTEKLPESLERRHCLRQSVRFGYIELGKHNGGIVLNISEGGLALQAARGVLSGDLPHVRFQFKTGGEWIESDAKIAWTSASQKMLGISFVDLQDKSRSEIRAWVASDGDPDKSDETANTAAVVTPDGSSRELGLEPLKTVNENANEESGDLRKPNAEPRPFQPFPQLQDRRLEVSQPEHTSSIADILSKSPQVSEETKTFSRTKSDWLIVMSVLILIGFLTISLLETGKRTAVSSKMEISSDGHMGMKLERSGGDLRLTWNPDAPVISNATKGRLLITDGNSRKFLELEPSDLRGGTLVYRPSTSDVVLRLEVDRRDSPVLASESVRISGAQPVSSPNSAPHLVSGAIRSSSLLVEPKLTASPASGEGAGETVLESSRSDLVGGEPGKTQRGSGANVLARSDKMTAQPVVKPRSDLAIPAPPLGIGLLSSGSSGAATPFVIPVAEEPLQSSNGFEPAQLITKRDPIYPAAAKDAHFKGVVELHFRIGADGKVHDIAVVKGNPILVTAALSAVQGWGYKPAKLNGTAVETDASATLDFK